MPYGEGTRLTPGTSTLDAGVDGGKVVASASVVADGSGARFKNSGTFDHSVVSGSVGD